MRHYTECSSKFRQRMGQQVNFFSKRVISKMNDSAYSRARSDKEIDARISQLRQQREKIMCNLTCFKKELTAYESKTKDCCSSNMIRKT
ncbi:hypothetical protein QE152_g8477 [Popillia japonica]|uniref:Uncharacterized protein n=1 Tax=Popillia japonica TaxID=7064 RepID=A0AAW1MA86_POPJA